MELKHTQSNWIYYLNRLSKKREYVISTDSCFIAIIKHEDIPEKEAEANAKLIASAPELLQSLIKLQKNMEHLIERMPTGERRNVLCDENIEALAIIQKATE